MAKMKKTLTVLLILLLVCGCYKKKEDKDNLNDGTFNFDIKETTVVSKRGTPISSIIYIPKTNGPYPYVVMLHGFNGDKKAGGLFEPIAVALAKHGVGSICIDFPGCGESSESHTLYTLSNMIDDVDSAIQAMHAEYNGDIEKVGLLGHSMGGRIAALRLNDSIKAAALLEPAANTGLLGIADFMDGMEDVQDMYEEAKNNGTVLFDKWGEPYRELSLAFFEENEAADPIKTISEYNGKLFLAVASMHYAISEETINAVIEAAKDVEVLNVPNSRHSFTAADGSDSTEARDLLTEKVSQFMVDNLK